MSSARKLSDFLQGVFPEDAEKFNDAAEKLEDDAVSLSSVRIVMGMAAFLDSDRILSDEEREALELVNVAFPDSDLQIEHTESRISDTVIID